MRDSKKNMAKIFFSIIIPVKEINNYLRKETIPAILKQTYQNFEIIILPDHDSKEKFAKTKIIPTWPKVGPADKRNLGVDQAKGEILAFLDDDAYPEKNWLEKALSIFELQTLSAVCGPGVTPPSDPLLAQVSGWMWASFLGSGGAGQYRCWPRPRREVDDYPTFNLLVKKKDFLKTGGFDARFWPGEDTKFCHDLVHRQGKKIIYDPQVLVYHHRRNIFLPHLKQIGRYGKHRGHFVKILPKTSQRLGYFMPMLFAFGVILSPILIILLQIMGFLVLARVLLTIYLFILGIYGALLLASSFWVLKQSKNPLSALLFFPTIFVSHLFYGVMFLYGLGKQDFQSKFGQDKL